MSDRSQIDAVLTRMEGVFADMAKTVDAEDLDQRRQLIAFRRALADCFADLNHAVDAIVSADRIDATVATDYRAQFSTFRRAVSLHQAEWPTILISDNMAGYVAASQTLRRQRETFMSWMRQQFLARLHAG